MRPIFLCRRSIFSQALHFFSRCSIFFQSFNFYVVVHFFYAGVQILFPRRALVQACMLLSEACDKICPIICDDSHLVSLFQVPEPIWGRGSSEFFQVPGPFHREKSIYDDSHLVSLYQVTTPIQGVAKSEYPLSNILYAVKNSLYFNHSISKLCYSQRSYAIVSIMKQ